MKNLFTEIHPSLIAFWKKHNRKVSDFYCKECGKILLTDNDVKYLEIIPDKHNPLKDVLVKRIRPPKNQKKFPFSGTNIYIEPAAQQWLLSGRELSGKRFFRIICWDCFFKRLRETVDIAKKARKSSWYKKLLTGNNIIPPHSTSASPIFKLLFDITDEELTKERKKFDTASRESFIKRHGEVKGNELFEKYSKRQSYTCSKEYMMNEKGMSEDQWNQFNKNRACTLKNFISRYGNELGTKKWNEYCAKEAYVGNSLMYFIEIYGEKIGKLRYQAVCDAKQFTYKAYSDESQQLFKKIDKRLGKIGKKSRWQKKNFEYELFLTIDKIQKICKVDYYLDGKIIEFNGDYWHANPLFYKAHDTLNIRGEIIKAEDIWNKEKKRLAALTSLGYKVKVVWEKDYRDDPEKIISECVEFLKA